MKDIEGEQNKSYPRYISSKTENIEQRQDLEEQRYLEELQEGKYLGILKTYISNEK